MKRSIFLIPLFMLALILPVLAGGHLQFSPENPRPGEKVQLTYDLKGSPLSEAAELEVVAYLLTEASYKATEIKFKKKGDHYYGELMTSDDTKAFFVLLTSEDGELTDNNGEKGYKLMMYQDDKKTPVQGAYFMVGYAYNNLYRRLGFEKNKEKGLKYLNKEFAVHPDSKMNPSYMGMYANIMSREKDEAAMALIREAADELSKMKKEEEKITLAHRLYTVLKAEKEAEKLEKKIRKKYPQGQLVKNDLQSKFYQSRGDLEKMEEYYAKRERLVDPSDESDKSTLGNMASYLARQFGQKGNMEKFEKYIQASTNKNGTASVLNSVAWRLVGQDLDKPADDLDKAMELSGKSLKLIKSQMEDIEKNKPDYYTLKQWKKSLENSYGMFADTYALICYKAGKYQDALKYQEKVINRDGYISPDMYERYVAYIEKAKGGEAAEEKLAEYIQDNKATKEMKEDFKRLFMTNNTLETAYEKHMAVLQKEAMKQLREELKKKMIDEIAPDFTLVNLDGETVKLSSLRGKTVVLDFWATWCGPCKASFPGMQKAVNKYKNNDKVVFLFIDTWENVENKEEVAGKFIEENNYTFNVPMDKDNKVVEAYKVSGIPTKFVVGPNGRIRFKSVGYNGDEDKLVTELSMMIEMAGQKGGKSTASLRSE